MGTIMVPFSYHDFIFDLDGTLLDTIEDISIAMNIALAKCGYDFSYTPKETMALVGDGADMAVRRALAFHNADLQGFDALKAVYMPEYRKHQNDHAHPFPALVETLTEMKRKGARLFVVTNKPDALAKVVVEAHYGPGFFCEILGAQEGQPVKPNPHLIHGLFAKYGLKKETTLYVGDSHVDIETARNADIAACLVKWGYDRYEEALLKRADIVLSHPKELADLI